MTKTFSAPYFITWLQFLSPSIALFLFSRINSWAKLDKSYPELKYTLHILPDVGFLGKER